MQTVCVFCAIAIALAPAARAADEAAGVILGVNGHVTVERQGSASRPALLGMKLEAVDVVVVDRAATAEVYLKGGGVVHLRDTTRFTMPKTADGGGSRTGQARLGSGSIAQLESGLWVLNDPQGSLLVSPMRGDAGWEAGDAAVPLTPRYEALASPSATFIWTGGPAKARVVVAQRREVVWKSAPAAAGTVLTPGVALSLAAGEVYTWWLEPEAGGPPLTAGMPFRVAAADVIERTKALEAELHAMSGAPAEMGAADYLRVAHYAGASSWTRVLELATGMPPSDARERALAAAAAGLRLDARTAATLAALLEHPVH